MHAAHAVRFPAATLAALDILGEATSTALRAEVELLQGSTVYAPHKSYGAPVPVGPRVLTCLSAAGEIVRASNRSSWVNSRPAWALTAAWLDARPVEPPERPGSPPRSGARRAARADRARHPPRPG